ncbi:serine hydrolase domain-containing protein [Roseateles sp. DB2]|uniref:serine hydrolase domain-containing protein n=1 Tax=Roseateles sp. DB2 TaxID=3453717 RepID=UPI003EEF9FE1
MDSTGFQTRRQLLAWLGMAGVGLGLQACGSGSDAAEPSERQRQALRLQAQAEACVKDGLVGVVMGRQDGVNAEALRAAAGRTQLSGGQALKGDERFIVGSNTKAMSAALAARCVERGLLRWDSRPAELLSGLAASQHRGYQDLTLSMLLDHRGGLPAFTDDADLERFGAYLQGYAGTLPATETGRRRFFVDWLLAQAPAARPGQDFRYSNAGYAVAAALLEAASGQDFKALFARELSDPLQLDVAWGAPVGAGQPQGHAGASPQQLSALPTTPDEQLAWLAVLAPAGEANLAAPSYGRWLQLHQLALQGRSSALPHSYISRLQALRPGDYALGWSVTQFEGRSLLLHTGANAGFMSLAALAQDGSQHLFALSNTFGLRADGSSWVLERLNTAAIALLMPL